MEWATLPLKRYAEFSGRSRRMEYWSFFLLSFAVSFVASIIDAVLGVGVVGLLVGLALLVPSIAVGVRRLHDTGRSGWWLLIGLVPLIGWIVLIVFFVSEGVRGPNEYGPDPKADGADVAERFA